MKRFALLTITLMLSAFGLLTVFLTGSVIFDLFDIRSFEGNYVLFIVWANLVSGVLFLVAALGLIKKKTWVMLPLVISAFILVLAFVGLIIHINTGGAYESKTIGAMIFRIMINLAIIVAIQFTSRRGETGHRVTMRSFYLLLPIVVLGAACNPSMDKGHQHEELNATELHEHADEPATPDENQHAHEASTAIELDNGKKWKADEHTLGLVDKMEHRVSAFVKNDQSNYELLVDSLTKDIDVLVVGCTMTGKAHDELHKWLVPYIDQVKGLSNAESNHEADEIIKELEASIHVFNQSFE